MACIAAMRHERQGFGVFQYYRERAARAAQGLPEPIDTELQDIYEAERWKIEGDANCHKCGLPMGVAKTLNTDGKYYHPECARGW
jgi:hypothetical protein